MKGRRIPATDVLLIVVSIVYGAYLMLSPAALESSQSEARAGHLLPLFSINDLQRLEYRGPGEPFTIQADQSHAGEFLLQGDVEGQADVTLVRELGSALEFATFKRRVPLANVPSKLRGQPPLLELHVVTSKMAATVRLLGATDTSSATAEGEVMVSVEDGTEKVWGVVSSELSSTLLRSKQEFRGRQLFPFSFEKTLSLRIADSAREVRLKSDALGLLLDPEGRRADRTLVDVLFYQLGQAKMERFIPIEQARALLEDDPTRKTVWQQGAGKSVEIWLGGSCPGDDAQLVAWRVTPPQIAGCTSRSVWAGLSLTKQELLDKTASVLTSDEIDHVIIAGPEPSLDLMRQKSEFVLLSEGGRKVPNEAAEELLRILTTARLTPMERPLHLPPVQRTITILGHSPQGRSTEETARQVLEVYGGEEDRLIAHRLDDDVWLEVPPSLGWAFSQNDFWAKSRELVHVAPEAIETARVEVASRPGWPEGAAQIERSEDGCMWGGNTNLGTQGKPDQTLCRQLLESLAQVTVVRFLADAPSPRKPWLFVEFGGKTKPAQYSVTVGERVRGGYLGWSTMTPSPFVLDEATVLTWSLPLADRSAAQLDPGDYTALELERDGRLVVLERVAGEFYPRVEHLSPEEVGPLIEAVASLRVLAQLPEEATTTRPQLVIRATPTQTLSPRVELQIFGLVPFQDTMAYRARRKGHPGTFLLSSPSVEALAKLL